MSNELLIGIHAVEAALNHDVGNLVELYIETGSAERAHEGTRRTRARARRQAARARPRGARPHDRRRRATRASSRATTRRRRARNQRLAELVEKAGRDALLLVLDGVTDPHNLGACLRSAEAAGVTAVIVPKDKAVGVTPTVRRASAGAADRVPLFAVTNLARTLKALKDAGVWLVGLAGEAAPQSVYAVDLKGPIAIVLGSEGEGMRRLTRERCDFLAHIPMRGEMESLNVSVATGVALFEALRQRG